MVFHKVKNELPSSYEPTEDTVIVAKGKKPSLAPGNMKLEALVQRHVESYKACGRRERAAIIRTIVLSIHKKCPIPFVKFDGQKYWEADELTIREKVSSLFRNQLSDAYRSSTKCKSALRRRKAALKSKNISLTDYKQGTRRLEQVVGQEQEVALVALVVRNTLLLDMPPDQRKKRELAAAAGGGAAATRPSSSPPRPWVVGYDDEEEAATAPHSSSSSPVLPVPLSSCGNNIILQNRPPQFKATPSVSLSSNDDRFHVMPSSLVSDGEDEEKSSDGAIGIKDHEDDEQQRYCCWAAEEEQGKEVPSRHVHFVHYHEGGGNHARSLMMIKDQEVSPTTTLSVPPDDVTEDDLLPPLLELRESTYYFMDDIIGDPSELLESADPSIFEV